MKRLKAVNYSNYSIEQLKKLFEHQTQSLEQLEHQKHAMQKNAYKTFKHVFLPRSSDQDLHANKKYYEKLQEISEQIDDARQTRNQIAIEINKKKKKKSISSVIFFFAFIKFNKT